MRQRRSPNSSYSGLEARGDRCAAESVNSVLPRVCRSRNAKALHLVNQCGALQAKSSSCSARASELPIGALAGGEKFKTSTAERREIIVLRRLQPPRGNLD